MSGGTGLEPLASPGSSVVNRRIPSVLLVLGVSLAAGLTYSLLPRAADSHPTPHDSHPTPHSPGSGVQPNPVAAPLAIIRSPVGQAPTRASTPSLEADALRGRVLFESGAPASNVPIKVTVPGDHVLFTGVTTDDGTWAVPKPIAKLTDAILRLALREPYLWLRIKGFEAAADSEVRIPDLETATSLERAVYGPRTACKYRL